MTTHSAAVVGQLARDLVLTVDQVPEAGASATATGRREQLGGKGANQAVALAQLGVRPVLVAVAGDDVIGDVLLDQARRDGIDVGSVVRRRNSLTGVIVEILDDDAGYRYVEDLPLLTAADVTAAGSRIAAADAVLIQLQQPAAATVAAARIGRDAGRLVVLDGVAGDEILPYADVVRADEKEAGQMPPPRELLDRGPKLVVIARADGNQVIWADGEELVPLTTDKVVDTTGGGDAFVAALTTALLRGRSAVDATRFATAASGATVGHPGGRPDLTGLVLDA